MQTNTRLNILGVGISAVDMMDTLNRIEGWLRRREPRYVCLANAHSIMECQRDETLRRVFNQADLVTPDGMPLVWLCHLAGLHHVRRVYGPDLMLAACKLSEQTGHRHFFYGGRVGVPVLLAERLRRRFPGLQIAGMYAPPFCSLTNEEDSRIEQMINASQTDILWVGLGTSRQEHWMAAHRERLNAPVMIGVGAAFDFLSGLKPQAPRWMRQSGLEWAFRLATEPRRLWRRYLLDNPAFILRVAAQILDLHDYSL